MEFPAGLTINYKSLWFYFTSTVSTQNRPSWLFFARPINVPKLKRGRYFTAFFFFATI